MPEKTCRNMVTVEGKSYPKCGNNYAMESQMACHSCIFGREVLGNCPECKGTGTDHNGCMCEYCRGTKNK